MTQARLPLLLALSLLLTGCPKDKDASGESSKTGSAEASDKRFSCFDHHFQKKLEQDGYLVELYRVRVLPNKERFYRREPFAKGLKGSKSSGYFALEVIVHQKPEGTAEPRLPLSKAPVVTLRDKELTLGGVVGRSGGGADGVTRIWGTLESPIAGGSPMKLEITYEVGKDSFKTFVFKDLVIPEEAFFWSEE